MSTNYEATVAAADDYAVEATAELARLIAECAQPAGTLAGFVAGHELNIDRMALEGSKADLEAWRSTRLLDARWRVLLAHWRDHWRKVGQRRSGPFAHLAPRGLDLYLWERPEDCDHENVRLGVTYVQIQGAPKLTPVHVDLVRVAQQDTPARLLGPTLALEIVGQDGIVQEAHPLRSGTVHAGVENVYRPDWPTWRPAPPEAPAPTRHLETGHDRAAWINQSRASGAMSDDGSVSTSSVPAWPIRAD
jgi:hypothetical protein